MQDIFQFLQHHNVLSTLLIIIIVLLFLIEFVRARLGTHQLSVGEATQLINRQDAVVVDIRSTEAFVKSHIIDAVSLPLADLSDKAKKLDKFKSRPLIIVCATGVDSPKAAEPLSKQGYQTKILSGGIQAWRSAELPLVKGQ